MRRLYLLSNGDINVRIAAKVIEADENTDFKREVSEFVKETGVEYMMVTINPIGEPLDVKDAPDHVRYCRFS